MANRSPKPSTSGQTQLKLGTMSSKDFKRLLDSQSLVDVTLACDGGQISAHKVVLSACSSYIHKILENHPVEHPIIILPELDIKDIRTLVNYMYTGELLTMNAPSHSLLKTAAVLNVNSLNDFFSESSTNSPSSSSSSPNLASLTTTTAAAAAAAINNHNNNKNGHNSSSTSSNTNTRNNAKNTNNVSKQLHKYNSRMMINNTNNTLTTSSDSKNNMNNVNDNVKYLNINNLQEFLGANYNHLDDDDFDDLMDESSDLQPDDSMMMLPNDASDDHAKIQKASSLNTSKSRFHLDMQFRCPVCEQDFYTICSFEYHMQRNHFVSSFGCEICDKPFASLRYVLTDHMRRCHGWLAEQEV